MSTGKKTTHPRVETRVAHRYYIVGRDSRLVVHQVFIVFMLEPHVKLDHAAPKTGFEKNLHHIVLKLHNTVLKLHYIASKLASKKIRRNIPMRDLVSKISSQEFQQ